MQRTPIVSTFRWNFHFASNLHSKVKFSSQTLRPKTDHEKIVLSAKINPDQNNLVLINIYPVQPHRLPHLDNLEVRAAFLDSRNPHHEPRSPVHHQLSHPLLVRDRHSVFLIGRHFSHKFCCHFPIINLILPSSFVGISSLQLPSLSSFWWWQDKGTSSRLRGTTNPVSKREGATIISSNSSSFFSSYLSVYSSMRSPHPTSPSPSPPCQTDHIKNNNPQHHIQAQAPSLFAEPSRDPPRRTRPVSNPAPYQVFVFFTTFPKPSTSISAV